MPAHVEGIASWSGAFVGRGPELALLRAKLAEAAAGYGGVGLIAGEPGIGKTRLAEALAEEARSLPNTPFQVLWGRCYEGEGAPAFWPWTQILRACAGGCEVPVLRQELGHGVGDVAYLLPELREQLGGLPEPPPLDTAQSRFRLFDSVAAYLKRAGRRRRVMVVIDDLHWADASSLALLQFLGRELRDAHLLLLGTYRANEVNGMQPLATVLADLSREENCERIHLHGLTEPDVDFLIRANTPTEPTPGLVTAIADETDGNPFFIREVVRLLLQEGKLHGGATVAEHAIPVTVREAIGRRLDYLSPACNQLLHVAAVLGRDFDLATLEQTAKSDRDAVLDALEEAERAQVIGVSPESNSRFRFAHALVREALYEELPAARRLRLHGDAGKALERLYGAGAEPHLAELAYHFLQAGPMGDLDQAIDYSVRAAQRASRLAAYEEAALHYGRALDALAQRPTADVLRRCDLMLAMARAQTKARDREQARPVLRSALDLARSAGDTRRFANMALSFSSTFVGPGVVHHEAIAMLEEALGGAAAGKGEDNDTTLHVRLLSRLAFLYYWTGDQERIDRLSTEAVALARTLGHRPTLTEALFFRCWALWGPEHLQERLTLCAEVVLLAVEIGNGALEVIGRRTLAQNLLELGDVAAAGQEIDLLIRRAEELRQPMYRWMAGVAQAMQRQMLGTFDAAEDLAIEALATGLRAHGPVQEYGAVGQFNAQAAPIYAERGGLDKIEPGAREAADRMPNAPVGRCLLAWIYSQMGREADARREFERLSADGFHGLGRELMSAPASLCLLAEVAAFLADSTQAAQLYDLLLPVADRYAIWGVTLVHYGSVARYLGMLAALLDRWDEAERHLEAALAMNANIGARAWIARTQYDYASMLLARSAPGDRERAMSILDRSRAIAGELGMLRLAEQLTALSARLCALVPTTPAPEITNLVHLTMREREALRLLAAGRSNQEMAAALVLSVRTVENHIFNLYAKLGVHGRVEAAAYAFRHGLD